MTRWRGSRAGGLLGCRLRWVPEGLTHHEGVLSFSNIRELQIDADARKQELYRRKVEQATVEREAYRKWQEEAQRLREVTEEFDKCVMSSGNSGMDKRP